MVLSLMDVSTVNVFILFVLNVLHFINYVNLEALGYLGFTQLAVFVFFVLGSLGWLANRSLARETNDVQLRNVRYSRIIRQRCPYCSKQLEEPWVELCPHCAKDLSIDKITKSNT